MITVAQRPLGKEFDGSGGRIGYVVICDDGEVEEDVIEAVAAVAPSSYTGLARGKVSAKEINIDPATGEPSMWDVEVPYGTNRARLVIPTNTVVWSGTTTGGTAHRGVGTVRGVQYTSPTGSVPEFAGLVIGGTPDGVAGVDYQIRVFSARATKYVAATDINAHRAAAFALTGQVNSGSFSADGQAFAAGEVLFGGMSWTKRTEVEPNDYECVFEFTMAPNKTNWTLDGTDIIVASKTGWQLLEFIYEKKSADGFISQVVSYVNVQTIYESGDFSTLGL